MNEDGRRRVVFLDTNALHHVHLYLTHARSESLYPFCPNGGNADEAKARLRTVTPKKLKESLDKGLKVIADLSTSDFQVEYSPVSELELIAGRARGRAIVAAAKEGIPDRMWMPFHDEEISTRLNMDDLADVGAGVAALSASLDEAGVQATVSSPARISDVFDLAKGIGSLVYIGFADSVIYASALVAEADYLITFDSYLGSTANRIKTGQPPYDEIRKRLRSAVAQILLADAEDVTLPEVTKRLPHGRH